MILNFMGGIICVFLAFLYLHLLFGWALMSPRDLVPVMIIIAAVAVPVYWLRDSFVRTVATRFDFKWMYYCTAMTNAAKYVGVFFVLVALVMLPTLLVHSLTASIVSVWLAIILIYALAISAIIYCIIQPIGAYTAFFPHMAKHTFALLFP